MPVDKHLPENSKANLDRALDHATEETFPTSDPVSVSVTRHGPSGEQHGANRSSAPNWRNTADDIAAQAKDALSGAASAAAEAVQGAYDQGSRYADAARQRYPEAERYYRTGTRAVRDQLPGSPLVTLLMGVALGYAVAWVVHARHDSGGNSVPEYARKDRPDSYRQPSRV